MPVTQAFRVLIALVFAAHDMYAVTPGQAQVLHIETFAAPEPMELRYWNIISADPSATHKYSLCTFAVNNE